MAGTFGLSAGAEPPRGSRPGKSGRGARRRRRRGRPCAHLAWPASSAGCGSHSRRRKARGLPSSARDGGQSARLARCTGQPGTSAWPAETLVPGVGSLGGGTM